MTSKQVAIYTTVKGGKQGLQSRTAGFKAGSGRAAAAVHVDAAHRFQMIEGFGGAFTEAAAVTYAKMRPPLQKEILKAYFDPRAGHGYTLCRTHINSCDFARGNYAYDEVAGDVALTHFSIDRDREALIPMIAAARKVSRGDLRLFASPWSPPAWMKTNGGMNNGGSLKPRFRAAWAAYYARYIKEYAAAGIPIWGLTVQNEPEACQRWDSCQYTGAEERDFVRDFLGPEMQRQGLGEIKIIIWDHNRDQMYARARAVLSDPRAARYVWGVGFHWYCGDHFENVRRVAEAFPDKKLLFTEGCQEGGPHLGEWEVGERYARSIINDLNRNTVGWVDWNLVLDEQGGPNHVGNYCSAPIIADTKHQRLHYLSSYYYIGHFARFIRAGDRRIISSATKEDLETTAFVSREGGTALVVMNRTDKAIDFDVQLEERYVPASIPARAIQTYVW